MKRTIFCLLVSVLALCFICGCHAELSENGIYEIAEFLDDAQYSAYMDGDGTEFHRLLDYHRQLAEAPEFAFYSFANNSIEIICADIPEECIVNHGTEYASESRYELAGEIVTAAEAIQVSENFFSLFPLEIAEGRGFDAADFAYTDAIPVILGDAYRGAFAVGDTFEGYYICERRTFTVIGFADAGSGFYLRAQSCMVPYDAFILMPFETVTEDSPSARAVLLQEICGFLVPQNDRSAALDTIRKYLKASGLEDWTDAILVNEKSIQSKMSENPN